jgi:uncharacterized membrane protein YqjE
MFPGTEGIEEVFPQLKRLGDIFRVLLTGVHHRMELAGLELIETRNEAVRCGLWWAGAVLLLVLGMATLTALVAAAFWDTPYRLAALGTMGGGYLLGALICLARVRSHLRHWRPFNETTEQIRKDIVCLENLSRQP